MNRSCLIAALFGSALLIGCAPKPKFVHTLPALPTAPTPALHDKTPDTCKSAGLQGLRGQPAGMIRTVRVDGPVRIIAPGELVTQEYNPMRIDVTVDAAGIITEISCG